MLTRLRETLSQETAADGLPRNRGEYRILEIDFERGGEKCRPSDWDYVFWGPWSFCAEPVMKCETSDEVFDFFDSYDIISIDDSMSKSHFPEAVLGGENDYRTIVDTITVEVAEGRCFVIRDWDRSKRAHRLFVTHSTHKWGDELNGLHKPLLEAMTGVEGYSLSTWRFKEYLVV